MTLEEFKTLKPGDKVKIIDTPVSKTNDGTPEAVAKIKREAGNERAEY